MRNGNDEGTLKCIFLDALVRKHNAAYVYAKEKMLQGINIMKFPAAKESSANMHILLEFRL